MTNKLSLLPKLLAAIFIMLATVGAVGQQAKNYSFTHFSPKNGMSSNYVNSIVQDNKGFIWIGTHNGLQRFDGKRFLTFRHNPDDKNSIPDDDVVRLIPAQGNDLWISFNSGQVGLFNTNTFKTSLVKLKVKDDAARKAFKYVVQDSRGNVFCNFGGNEMMTYNAKANEFSEEYNFIPRPKGWRVWQVVENVRDNSYLLTADSGFAVYNRATKVLSYRGHNIEKNANIELLKSFTNAANLMVDDKQRLWFHTWNVGQPGPLIYCYDLARNEPVLKDFSFWPVIKQYHEPDAFLQQRDGSVWITGASMLGQYLEKEKTFRMVPNEYTNEQSIQFERIRCLYEDREKNLWAGTNNNGLFLFNPSEQLFTSIRHYNRSSNVTGTGAVMSFCFINNKILAGAWGNGIYAYDTALNNIPLNITGLSEQNAYSAWGMYKGTRSKVWMALQGGEVIEYDSAVNKATVHSPPLFDKRTVRQVVEDMEGNLWFGTQSAGVFKWTASKATRKFEDGLEAMSHLPTTLITKLYIDNQGYLWVCTPTNGVLKVNTSNNIITEHIKAGSPANKALTDNVVNAICEYNDSLMVIGGLGLNFYNTKAETIEHFTNLNGLPDKYVSSIEKDSKGYLWIGLNNGLCRMDIFKKTLSFYDRNDGMNNDNFIVSSSYRLPDGRLIFGTSNDFVVFNPDDVVTKDVPPDVVISGFKISDRKLSIDSISKMERVDLAHNQNFIEIEFASLSYLKKNKLIYYYRLDGVDKDWKIADETQKAIYNFLPPGTYTFHVKSANVDGRSSNSITSLRIHINAPFWQTWWFYSLLALIVAALLYWMDKERTRRKETVHHMRSEIAGNLHQKINTALNNINILSEIARIKADRDLEKSKEYIDQIHQKSHRIIIDMDDVLWSIDPANDNMEKTVLRMKEYADALENRHGTEMKMDVENSVKKIKLDMKTRNEFFLFYKYAVRVLVEYGNANKLVANIECVRHVLALSIQAKGLSYDESDSRTEVVIQKMKDKAERMKATVDVVATNGTCSILLQVPVK